MSPEQIKAARALANWSRVALATEAGLSPSTIKNVEAGKAMHPATANVIESAFRRKGIAFTPRGVEFESGSAQ